MELSFNVVDRIQNEMAKYHVGNGYIEKQMVMCEVDVNLNENFFLTATK